LFQSILIISIIFCCWLFSIHFAFNIKLANNFLFFNIFYGEIVLSIIFHRYIFFFRMFFFEKQLLIIYLFLRKYYVDILLIIVSYVFVYYFLTGYSLYYWESFFSSVWHTLRFYIYMYSIYITIAFFYNSFLKADYIISRLRGFVIRVSRKRRMKTVK
jgi:hypothetical protein